MSDEKVFGAIENIIECAGPFARSSLMELARTELAEARDLKGKLDMALVELAMLRAKINVQPIPRFQNGWNDAIEAALRSLATTDAPTIDVADHTNPAYVREYLKQPLSTGTVSSETLPAGQEQEAEMPTVPTHSEALAKTIVYEICGAGDHHVKPVAEALTEHDSKARELLQRCLKTDETPLAELDVLDADIRRFLDE